MIKVKAWLLLVAILALFGCGGQAGDASQTTPGADKPGSIAAGSVHPGKAIYENFCFSCHLTGLNGAPKLGDIQGWAPRIAKGPKLLLKSTVEGMGTIMPARGMCFDCSDEDLAAAVDYMVVNSQ